MIDIQIPQANFSPRVGCILARKARTNIVRRRAAIPKAKQPVITLPFSGYPCYAIGTPRQWFTTVQNKRMIKHIYRTIGDEIYEPYALPEFLRDCDTIFDGLKYEYINDEITVHKITYEEE